MRAGAIVLAMLLAGAVARGTSIAAQEPPLTVTLTLDRGAYPPGVPIAFAVRIRNNSAAPITIPFTTAQRFDIAIFSDTLLVDQWSRGRTFPSFVGELRLAPGETTVFTDTWLPVNPLVPGLTGMAGSTLGPGLYRVVAQLTGRDTRPTSQSVPLILGTPTIHAAGCSAMEEPPRLEMPVVAFARTVNPPEALRSIWQRGTPFGGFAGYSPRYANPSDLATLNRAFPVTICLSTEAELTLP